MLWSTRGTQHGYVAAYGPVWSDGGERGVYKSTDGGETWTCVKSVSAYTGCNNLIMDPRDPKVLYAAFHQRQRKVFTYIGGGPESAFLNHGRRRYLEKTRNGLPWRCWPHWHRCRRSTPTMFMPSVEAPEKKGGIYRSTDRGASWTKMSDTYTSGNYYQELTCDPKNLHRIFITDTYYKVSDDGGKTVRNLGELNKHIDNHCIWIDPDNTDHLRVGCDGGIYETWDFAKTWEYKHNLPVTQFYKVSTDNALPFYHVHGGTQDNLSLGGPSRTTSANGIPNSDGTSPAPGDGFETQVDPTNPDIIYAQSQYGGLVRFDRKSGEYLPIKPAARRKRTRPALELGRSTQHLQPRPNPALHRRQQGVPHRRPRQRLARHQPRSLARRGPQQIRNHGQGVECGRHGQKRLHRHLRPNHQHRRKQHSMLKCSGWAPTMAYCG
jgi:hypothetical protein